MSDLATARDCFLAKVSYYAPGEAVRFTGPLDALIQWSEANGLVFTPGKVSEAVKFSVPGSRLAFWSALPRAGDGAKFLLLSEPRFPEPLRAAARDELARIDGKDALPEAVPAMPFTKLIWEPYRTRVLDLMGRLLTEMKRAGAESPETAVA
jgi:hypothetical protein